jgi:hypothetical protein
MKINLSEYDNLARDMRLPKDLLNTTKLTKLPDNFEPKASFTEHNDFMEEYTGNIVP